MEIAWFVYNVDIEMKEHRNRKGERERETSTALFHYPSIFAEQYRRINRAMNF